MQLFISKESANDRNMSTEHIATCCVRLATLLQHVGCFWLKFEGGQIWAHNFQHDATRRNRTAKRAQHVAPNNVTPNNAANVAICLRYMLR